MNVTECEQYFEILPKISPKRKQTKMFKEPFICFLIRKIHLRDNDSMGVTVLVVLVLMTYIDVSCRFINSLPNYQ